MKQSVHILLECILVSQTFCQKLYENERILNRALHPMPPPPPNPRPVPPMLILKESNL